MVTHPVPLVRANIRVGSVLIVVVDSATPAITAALAKVTDADARLLARRVTVDARAHGELLAPAIEAVLQESGVRPRELGAVVAGIGPGPFTGLRVGLVTGAAPTPWNPVPARRCCRDHGDHPAAAVVAHPGAGTDRSRPVRRRTLVGRHVLERARQRPPLRRRAGGRGADRVRRAERQRRRGLGAEHRGTPGPAAARNRSGVAAGAPRRSGPPPRALRPPGGRRGQRYGATVVRQLRLRARRGTAGLLPTQQHRRPGDETRCLT